MPEGCRASFEMGSSLFSTKISFSFINIRICVCPLLKESALLQLSTCLLPIAEVLDRKYFKSYHNLHINNGGIIFFGYQNYRRYGALMSEDTFLYAITDIGERKKLKR